MPRLKVYSPTRPVGGRVVPGRLYMNSQGEISVALSNCRTLLPLYDQAGERAVSGTCLKTEDVTDFILLELGS